MGPVENERAFRNRGVEAAVVGSIAVCSVAGALAFMHSIHAIHALRSTDISAALWQAESPGQYQARQDAARASESLLFDAMLIVVGAGTYVVSSDRMRKNAL